MEEPPSSDPRRWYMYARQHSTLGAWTHVGSRRYTERCGPGARPVEVRETTGEDSTHWGWLATGASAPSMIQPRRIMFDAQFTYGPDAAVEAGKGQILRLVVEPAAEPDPSGETSHLDDGAHGLVGPETTIPTPAEGTGPVENPGVVLNIMCAPTIPEGSWLADPEYLTDPDVGPEIVEFTERLANASRSTRFIEASAGLSAEQLYWLWSCLNDDLPDPTSSS